MKVLYNGSCPICSREIDHYKRRTVVKTMYVDLNTADLTEWGIDKDTAKKRLYVQIGEQIYSGVDAFAHLWSSIPLYKPLAVFVRLPVIYQLANITYDYILAPVLYKLNTR